MIEADASANAQADSSDARRSELLGLLLVALAVALGMVLATRVRWVCDDAFISFRYAENLVNGLGLVFNAGERVEGYTNFLWTLWTALGLRLGADAEVWSMAWGVVFYGGTIGLLAVYHRRVLRLVGAVGPAIPVAAFMAALNGDWNIWATGGLETSFFTFLCLAAYVLLVTAESRYNRLALAGVAFALACMARPDGIIFAALAGLWVPWTQRPRWRSALVFGGVFLLIWGPYTAWRVAYYEDFFPNTYYAKSAYLAWWSQGWVYVRLYFTKYWALLAGPALCLVAWVASWRHRDESHGPEARRLTREAVLAAAFALAYTAYVMRVGGGFMYARLLIPATPFFLILVELGLYGWRAPVRWARVSERSRLIGSIVLIAATAWMPHPLPDRGQISGIANEWLYYLPEQTEKTRSNGEVLRKYFAGLPVCVGFFGTEARLVYYAKPAVAIECDAGLTDRWIARRPLAERGRVGHEKKPTADYLIYKRKVHFVFHPLLDEAVRLDAAIPPWPIWFDDVSARVVHWDSAVMAALRERGARFKDFPAFLDRLLAAADRMDPATLRDVYAKCRRFYFDQVNDPARETAFRAALNLRAGTEAEAE
jgi:hypothetical protein